MSTGPDPFAAPPDPPPPPAPPAWPAAYGEPGYGPDGRSGYGPAAYGQAGYGQVPDGQVGYGQSGYGPVPHGQPGYGAVPYGPGPYGQPGYGPAPDRPADALYAASSRATVASALLWVLVPVWGLFLVAGLVLLGARGAHLEDAEAALAADDRASVFAGLGVLGFLTVGAALWALLALWSSWTARAARAVGRPVDGSLSHLAWWGGFVPIAALVLPALAYAKAGRTLDGAVRGGPGRVPPLLAAWWGLFVLAFLGVVVAAGTGDAPDRSFGVDGAGLLVAGLAGIAASVCGALALRTAAAQARTVADRLEVSGRSSG